jgi:hypothetical protein
MKTVNANSEFRARHPERGVLLEIFLFVLLMFVENNILCVQAI